MITFFLGLLAGGGLGGKPGRISSAQPWLLGRPWGSSWVKWERKEAAYEVVNICVLKDSKNSQVLVGSECVVLPGFGFCIWHLPEKVRFWIIQCLTGPPLWELGVFNHSPSRTLLPRLAANEAQEFSPKSQGFGNKSIKHLDQRDADQDCVFTYDYGLALGLALGNGSIYSETRILLNLFANVKVLKASLERLDLPPGQTWTPRRRATIRWMRCQKGLIENEKLSHILASHHLSFWKWTGSVYL